jgi:hypothetical protein
MNDEIADAETVRRGILFRHLAWDRRHQRILIDPQAFLLRRNDAGELSVQRASLETVAETFQRLPRSEAVAELLAEDVRDLGLDVAPRPGRESPAHAAILGLPIPDFQNPNAPESVLARERSLELTRIRQGERYRIEVVEELVQRLIDAG